MAAVTNDPNKINFRILQKYVPGFSGFPEILKALTKGMQHRGFLNPLSFFFRYSIRRNC